MAEKEIAQSREIVTRAEARRFDLPAYWTGKACIHGHIGWRRTVNGSCVQCERNAMARARVRANVLPLVSRPRAIAKTSGERYYFTGVPCKNGHIDRRLVSTRMCISCNKIVDRYAARDQGRQRIPAPDSERKCLKCGEMKTAADFWANQRSIDGLRSRCIQCVSVYSQDWRLKKREYRAVKDVAYRQNNQEKVARAKRSWRLANPEKWVSYKANRRARVLGVGGKYTSEDVMQLAVRQKNKCAHPWCRRGLSRGRHVDHIKPLAIGGSNDRRNIQLLCPKCNRSKGAKHPIVVALQHGLLV